MHLKYCIINGKNYYYLRRSLRQSSFSLNLSLMSPDISDEYGQAISLRKPLISSWKLSISFTPMEINAQLMAFYRNIKLQSNFFNLYTQIADFNSPKINHLPPQ